MNQQLLKIKDFWDKQAVEYSTSALATMPDLVAFEMELKQLLKHIPLGSKILDVGCGNGVKGIEIGKRIDCDYCGIDYSNEMIFHAKTLLVANKSLLQGSVCFDTGDVLKRPIIEKYNFDFVVSVRCLINLETEDNQVLAVENLWPHVKDKGFYLMFENSLQSLLRINDVRKTFSLPDINVRWHNSYLNETTFFQRISKFFKLVDVVNYESTYFLISRTLNALLSSAGKEIDYLSQLNQWAAQLPALGDYSPQKLFILEKIS